MKVIGIFCLLLALVWVGTADAARTAGGCCGKSPTRGYPQMISPERMMGETGMREGHWGCCPCCGRPMWRGQMPMEHGEWREGATPREGMEHEGMTPPEGMEHEGMEQGEGMSHQEMMGHRTMTPKEAPGRKSMESGAEERMEHEGARKEMREGTPADTSRKHWEGMWEQGTRSGRCPCCGRPMGMGYGGRGMQGQGMGWQGGPGGGMAGYGPCGPMMQGGAWGGMAGYGPRGMMAAQGPCRCWTGMGRGHGNRRGTEMRRESLRHKRGHEVRKVRRNRTWYSHHTWGSGTWYRHQWMRDWKYYWNTRQDRGRGLHALDPIGAAFGGPLYTENQPLKKCDLKRCRKEVERYFDKHGYLGLLTDWPGGLAEPVVTDVAAGSPAEKAGIQKDDILESVNGVPFLHRACYEMREMTACGFKPNETVTISVKRGVDITPMDATLAQLEKSDLERVAEARCAAPEGTQESK
jgi:hypothetical protein